MNTRSTKQKVWIDEGISHMHQFFTAEDLFRLLKRKHPQLGIATVYRALQQYKEQRRLHTYICNRRTLYSTKMNNHCHFICERCNKVTHVNITSLDFMKKNLPGDLCHFQLELHGICKQCKR